MSTQPFVQVKYINGVGIWKKVNDDGKTKYYIIKRGKVWGEENGYPSWRDANRAWLRRYENSI